MTTPNAQSTQGATRQRCVLLGECKYQLQGKHVILVGDPAQTKLIQYIYQKTKGEFATIAGKQVLILNNNMEKQQQKPTAPEATNNPVSHFQNTTFGQTTVVATNELVQPKPLTTTSVGTNSSQQGPSNIFLKQPVPPLSQPNKTLDDQKDESSFLLTCHIVDTAQGPKLNIKGLENIVIPEENLEKIHDIVKTAVISAQDYAKPQGTVPQTIFKIQLAYFKSQVPDQLSAPATSICLPSPQSCKPISQSNNTVPEPQASVETQKQMVLPMTVVSQQSPVGDNIISTSDQRILPLTALSLNSPTNQPTPSQYQEFSNKLSSPLSNPEVLNNQNLPLEVEKKVLLLHQCITKKSAQVNGSASESEDDTPTVDVTSGDHSTDENWEPTEKIHSVTTKKEHITGPFESTFAAKSSLSLKSNSLATCSQVCL